MAKNRDKNTDEDVDLDFATADYSARMLTGFPTIDILTCTPSKEIRDLTYDEFMKNPNQIFKHSVAGLSIGFAIMLFAPSGFGKSTWGSNLAGSMIHKSKAKVIYYQTESGATSISRICNTMFVKEEEVCMVKGGTITQEQFDKYKVFVIPDYDTSVEHLKTLNFALQNLKREMVDVRTVYGTVEQVKAPIVILVDSISTMTTIERDERNSKLADSEKVKDAEALNQEDLKIGKAFDDFLKTTARHWAKNNICHIFIAHSGDKSTMGGMPPVREFKNLKNTSTWKGSKKVPFYCSMVFSGSRFAETKTDVISKLLGEDDNNGGTTYQSITSWALIKNRLGPDVADTTVDLVHETKHGVLADKSFMYMLMSNPLMTVCDLKGSLYTTRYYVKPDGSPKSFSLKNFTTLFEEEPEFKAACFKRLAEVYFGKWCFSNYSRSKVLDIMDDMFSF